jgi:hypothetical protein
MAELRIQEGLKQGFLTRPKGAVLSDFWPAISNMRSAGAKVGVLEAREEGF